MGFWSSSRSITAASAARRSGFRLVRKLQLFSDCFGELPSDLGAAVPVSQDLQEALERVVSEMRGDVPEGERPGGHFRSVIGSLADQFEELGHDVVREPRGDERLGPLDRLGRRTLRVARHIADVRPTPIVEADQTARRLPTSEGSTHLARAAGNGPRLGIGLFPDGTVCSAEEGSSVVNIRGVCPDW
jgi:hypothetical protein